MNYIRKYNKILLILVTMAAVGLFAVYVLRGNGIKKNIISTVLLIFSLLMWKTTRWNWWLFAAEVLVLPLFFFEKYPPLLGWMLVGVILLLPFNVLHERWNGARLVFLTAVFAYMNFVLVQDGMEVLPFLMAVTIPRQLLNLVCYFAAYLIVYIVCGKWKTSMIAVLFATAFFAALNMQIYDFRGSELKLVDILSVGTAMQVAGNYQPDITGDMIRNWICTALWAGYFGAYVKFEEPKFKWRRSLSLVGICLCVLTVACSRDQLSRFTYKKFGSQRNGFLLNIMANTFTLEKPDGYDSFDFSEIEEEYCTDPELALPDTAPNIVVIMSEAYSDLRMLGKKLQTNVPVYAFVDSLSENTIKGRALVSIHGGNTANSEYEFFTGNSMAFLPNDVVAYMQYVKDDSFALPAYLKSLGYNTFAMHPQNPRNWARIRVWEQLGFEERMYYDAFPKEKIVRSYVSDEEVFDLLLQRLQNNSADEPMLVFALTMQNHGGYTDESYESTVKLEGLSQSYPEAEQYLSLIRESDQALEKLITGLQNLEKDTIVLLFGDHLPRLPDAFYEELIGTGNTLENRQKLYEVPYLLWANYDIPEESTGLTGLNYLSIDLLELAGIPLPSYAKFLQDVRQTVPAMNPMGYYSQVRQEYVSWEQPLQEEKSILDTYRIMTYNAIQGGKNLSSIFAVYGE